MRSRALILRLSICALVLLSCQTAAGADKQPSSGQTAASSAPKKAPAITSPAQTTFVVGKPNTFTIKATESPTAFNETTGLLESLGLTLDEATGRMTGSAKTPGTYAIGFKAINAVGPSRVQHFTLKIVQVPPCQDGTYTVRLRSLKDADADGLAQAVNGAFDNFTAMAVAAAAPSSGNQTKDNSGEAPAAQSKQDSASPKQFVCVYLRETDPATGSLKIYTPAAAIPPAQTTVEQVIARLDRPAFSGVNLDDRYVVYLPHIGSLANLVAAFRVPAPGLELDPDDAIGPYLILRPALSELQLTTKAAADLATQAAKVKRDLLALDAQFQLANLEGPAPALAITNIDAASPDAAVRGAEYELVRWDARHTIALSVLEPREVSSYLAGEPTFAQRYLKLLATQRAITIRPAALAPGYLPAIKQRGIDDVSDASERAVLYAQYEARQAWEQKLQADAGTGTKGGGAGNSSQPPVTTTKSSTTITTPSSGGAASPGGSSYSKNAAAIQIQTTTSTETTTSSGGPGSTGAAGQNSSGAGQSAGDASGGNGAGAGGGGGRGGGGGNSGSSGGKSGSGSGDSEEAGRKTPPAPVSQPGMVVRLYHLRQAANIATVINATVPGNGNPPLVEALSDFNNDDLLLILPPAPGQKDNTDNIRRMIASLDEPRPAVSLQVWSYEISADAELGLDDRRGRREQAKDIAASYKEFSRAVQDADYQIQQAMANGLATAINIATQMPNFFDSDFQEYLTEKSQNCVSADHYCLGFDTALKFGAAALPGDPNNAAVVSFNRFVLLLAAAADSHLLPMIDQTLNEMNTEPLKFKELGRALHLLAQPSNLHMFRAAVLDFLFQYKWSQAYPDDFDPYYLQRSAQNLDGYLNTLVVALNRDLDRYIESHLEFAANQETKRARHIGLANYGEVQVNAISGDSAAVSATVNNYFDITQPALLKDLVASLAMGAGGGGGGNSGGGNGGSAGNGGGGGGSGGQNSSGSGNSGSNSGSDSGGNSNSGNSSKSGGSGGGNPVAAAASLLTPWQAVALNALAAASAPPQLMAQVNAQTTLGVTPISLDTASAAELDLSLQVSNPTTTIDAAKGGTSSFIRQDLANSVANYSVKTKVRVDSLKLFQVSSLSMELTHAQSPVPIPVVGWAWEAVFGMVPVMKDFMVIPRAPKTVQNRAIAVVRAVVVPTAMDLGLSLPFRGDRIDDPLTGASVSYNALAQTSYKFQEFHHKLMYCILAGAGNCMSQTHLSDIPEQVHGSN